MFDNLIAAMPSIGANMHKDRLISDVVAGCGLSRDEAFIAVDMAVKGVDDAIAALFRSASLLDNEAIAMQSLSLAFQFILVAATTHHEAFIGSVKGMGGTVARQHEDGSVTREGGEATAPKFAIGSRVEIHDRDNMHYGHNAEVIATGEGYPNGRPIYYIKVLTGPKAGAETMVVETELRAG